MIRAIEHIAIAARDTAGLARWYCDTLGFRAVVDGGPHGIWFVGPPEGAAVVEIVPATAAPRAERERNDAGWSHLAFTVSDFDAVVDFPQGQGGDVHRRAQRRSRRAAPGLLPRPRG